MTDPRPTPEQEAALRAAAQRLAVEFEGTFGSETIDHYLASSYQRLATRANVDSFLPLMTERFARQRLHALARIEGREDADHPTVLFLCTHDAGRSQMALGWLKHLAGTSVIAWSAGTDPGSKVNPAAVAVMTEIGIDIADEFPEPWTNELVRAANVIIAIGNDRDFPTAPGTRYEEWKVDDPEGQHHAAIRPIRDEIGTHVRELLATLKLGS